MKTKLLYLLLAVSFVACKNVEKSENETSAENTAMDTTTKDEKALEASDFEITPISHATAVFTWDKKVFYIDPVGGAEAFEGQPEPDIILITDIHGDHLNKETLEAVATSESQIIVPQAVADQLGDGFSPTLTILNNGETADIMNFTIKAIPMYNLREEAKQFHTKGRGNGYVLENDGMRVYFSGDTEDIPEMRNLKNIDKAFICMNLPYTMTVESAADGVLAFAPDQVYPYHFRGQGGLSDTDKFKELVTAENDDIEVVMLDWYPNM
ncbi:MAG: MBL fold metallo-hydrolase [Leeuwenhoekiella sp.]